MNKDELPKTLYQPGWMFGPGVVHFQAKQKDGRIIYPVWGNREKLFEWLREGGADLICKLERVERSKIVITEEDANDILRLCKSKSWDSDRGINYVLCMGQKL